MGDITVSESESDYYFDWNCLPSKPSLRAALARISVTLASISFPKALAAAFPSPDVVDDALPLLST